MIYSRKPYLCSLCILNDDAILGINESFIINGNLPGKIYYCMSTLFSVLPVSDIFYRPRSSGDNQRVCVSVRLSVSTLLFEPFDI